MTSKFKTLSTAKLQQRQKALAVAPKFILEQHHIFLEASAAEIVARIGSKEWTATEVVTAYIARAAEAHAVTNCGTEILFEDALREARALDAEFATTQKLRGLLHGVPISLKVTTLLRAAGAIPIIKTNVPQTLFAMECSNPVFGATTNPYNSFYSSGGSSGGEAALLAMDGSALGVGSDIGGSLRVPAALCGVYSLKPSMLRVSYIGAGEPTPGFDGIISVAGPMGRSVDDLDIFARLTLGVPGRSHTVSPILYRESKLKDKLRFGYYTEYYAKASPASRRAVVDTVAALRKQGHECVEVEIPTPDEAMRIYLALCSADGYKTLLSGAGSDPVEEALQPISILPALPSFIRNFICWVIGFQDPQLSHLLAVNGCKSVQELFEWTVKRDEYVATFCREVWDKHQLDGIIAPMLALPQLPHGSFSSVFQASCVTCLYNLVNSPVGCLPVTRIDPTLDALTPEWTSSESAAPSMLYKTLYLGSSLPTAPKHLRGKPMYDVNLMSGMPVGVQVVGKKWEDEKVLAMMRIVDDALGPRGFGPGSWKGNSA
ncbi:amidase signature domain-containing protein [Mycena amicta]|nr:amidase signature domain-containing protein [Mycena amicta]